MTTPSLSQLHDQLAEFIAREPTQRPATGDQERLAAKEEVRVLFLAPRSTDAGGDKRAVRERLLSRGQ